MVLDVDMVWKAARPVQLCSPSGFLARVVGTGLPRSKRSKMIQKWIEICLLRIKNRRLLAGNRTVLSANAECTPGVWRQFHVGLPLSNYTVMICDDLWCKTKPTEWNKICWCSYYLKLSDEVVSAVTSNARIGRRSGSCRRSLQHWPHSALPRGFAMFCHFHNPLQHEVLTTHANLGKGNERHVLTQVRLYTFAVGWRRLWNLLN